METTLRSPMVGKAITRDQTEKASARRISVRRILLPVDFSEASLIAIDYASKVATRLGAELNLVHVFEPLAPFVGTEDNPFCLSDAEGGILAREHLRAAAERRGIPLRPEHLHVNEGRAFEEICRLARKLGIDLIIIPTRGHTGFKHLTLGSTAESIVRYSPCPV